MSKKVSLILKIAFALFILCVVSVVWFVNHPKGFFLESKKGQQRLEHLLCDTDFNSLLEACREISRMYDTGELKKLYYKVRLEPDPEVTKFPKLILDLEPTCIYINSDGKVQVELFGGIDHFGVYAYPENYKPPSSNFHYGDRKLVDGLWYYDDGYFANPKYGKGIEELIQIGKRKQQKGVDDSNN